MTSGIVGTAKVVISADLAAFGRQARTQLETGLKQLGPVVEKQLQAMTPISEKAGASAGRAFALALSSSAESGLARLGPVVAAQFAAVSEAAVAAGSAETQAATRIGAATQRTTRARVRDTEATGAQSDAQAELAALLAGVAGQTSRVQASTLRAASARARDTELNEAGTASFRQLAASQATVIGTQRTLTRALEEQAAAGATSRSALSRMGGALAGVTGLSAKAATGLGGAVLGLLSIHKVVDVGNEFRTALNGVQAASHATNEQMKAVSAESIALGRDMKVPGATAVDAAEAINDLVRAGMKLPRAMAAARPALLLSAAAQVKTADGARYLGDVLDDFGLSGDKAAHVANVLAGASMSAGGGLTEMFEAMKYAGPFARAAGVNVDSLATAIAELAKSGIQGSMAGTGLRQMLLALAKDSPKTDNALHALGVTAFNAQGKFVGLPSLLDQLHQAQERFGSNTKGFLNNMQAVFGARGGLAAVALAHRGIQGYEQFAKVIAKGDVQKYAELMNRGVSANMRAIEKRFTAAGLTIYSKLEPALITATHWLGTAVPHAISVLADVLGPTVRLIGGALVGAWHAAVAVLGPVAGALGDVAHFLSEHQGLTTSVATGVLAMWAAWKGWTIARAAIASIGTSLEGLATRAAAARLVPDALAAGMASAATKTQSAAVAMGYSYQSVATEAEAAAATSAAAGTTIGASATAAAEEVDAAGAAASTGWSAALGPLALVGVGVGLLTMLLGHNSDKAQDNKKAMEGYADSLRQSSNALAAVNTNQTVKQLQDDKSISLLGQVNAANKALNITQGDLVLAVNKGGEAYTTLRNKLLAYADSTQQGKGYAENYTKDGKAAQQLADNIETLRHSFTAQQKQQALAQQVERQAQALADGGASAAAGQAKALGLTSNAYLDAQTAAKKNTEQTKQQTAAFQLAGDAASLFQQALDNLAGINLSVATAQTSLASANLQVKQSFKDNGKVIRGNSQAAVNNQQAIEGSVSAAQQYAEAVGKQTHSSAAAVRAFKSSKVALEDQLRSQHELTPAVQKYIDQLFDLGKLKVPATPLDVDKRQADAKIKSLQGQMDRIRQNKVPGMDANSAPGRAKIRELQAQINALKGKRVPLEVTTANSASVITGFQRMINSLHGKQVTVTTAIRREYSTTYKSTDPRLGDGAPRAGGGWAHGPGTSTSDSFLQPTSNGEFTVNALDARRWGPELEAMNAGRNPFASVGTSIPNNRPTPAAVTDHSAVLTEIHAQMAQQTALLRSLPGLGESFARTLDGGAKRADLHGRTVPVSYFA